MGLNAVCNCNDPLCNAGITTSVPDKTYVTSVMLNGLNCSISIIIEQNGLTLTVVNENSPENYMKYFTQANLRYFQSGLVGSAIGSLILADQASVAGNRYNFGINNRNCSF